MLVRLFALGAVACAPEVSSGVTALEDADGASGSVVIPDGEPPSFGSAGLHLTPPSGGGDTAEDTAEAVVDPPVSELLADSVAEFSGEQGRDGWYYGYLEPGGANTFVEMPSYVEGGADPGWYAGTGGVYWTMMDASTMHPNGVTTTGGRSPVEQWAVRRWISEVDGQIEVKGHFAKLSVDGTSNGVAAYVFIDGEMDWAWYLEGWDDGGVDYDKVLTVAEGSTVDIVLDPWKADDRSDRSTLTAQVWSVIEE